MNRKLHIMLVLLTAGWLNLAYAEESCESGSCASGLRSPSLLQTGAVSRAIEEQEEAGEGLHVAKQKEWEEAHSAALERLNAVKLIDSGLVTKPDPGAKVKEHGKAVTGHKEVIQELDDNQKRRDICAKCTAAEEKALQLVLVARDAHQDAQKKSQTWLEATQLHEKTTGEYNQKAGHFKNTHETWKAQWTALTHASATTDFAKIKSFIDDLHKISVEAQALGVKVEKHRVARESAKSVYDEAARKAAGADKIAEAASEAAQEACAPLGIQPDLSCLSLKNSGCNGIKAQQQCLSSRDGRSNIKTHSGFKVYEEPCVWCGAAKNSCGVGNGNQCEPLAWLRGKGLFKPGQHDVAGCLRAR